MRREKISPNHRPETTPGKFVRNRIAAIQLIGACLVALLVWAAGAEAGAANERSGNIPAAQSGDPAGLSRATAAATGAEPTEAVVLLNAVEIDNIEDGRLLFRTRARGKFMACLLYTSPSPRDRTRSRMPSSA